MGLSIRLLAVFIVLVASVSDIVGENLIHNSIQTNAGSISYFIDKSDGIGRITEMPKATEVANNNFISVAVEGCSIEGALWIEGGLAAKAASGDYAFVTGDIKGPAASASDYNLYGYVTPNLAWAGQYVGSARGSEIDLQAIGNTLDQGNEVYWAGSYLFTHKSNAPVYEIANWYQDGMAGAGWAMANIYSGTVGVISPNPDDSLDAYTGSKVTFADDTYTEVGAQAYVTQLNFITIRGLSMGYTDPNLLYSNVDAKILNTNVYDYWYINRITGSNIKDTVYW